MKQYKEFKVGDKVEILSLATSVGVEREDVGRVGVINLIGGGACSTHGFMVQMNEVCKARGCMCCWSVGSKMIKLFPGKNQQLLFNFMD